MHGISIPGGGHAKAEIQPVGSLLRSCVERPARWNAVVQSVMDQSETVTKLRVRTGHALADNQD